MGERCVFVESERGRSRVWEYFSYVCDADGKQMKDFVACKICKSVYKFSGNTSNLVKHKCYIISCRNNQAVINVNSETKKEATTIATKWIVRNCRPFKVISDTGLKEFATFLINVGATYGANVDVDNLLPHSTTISRNVALLYQEHFGPVKADIGNFKRFGYAITNDVWTDNHLRLSYLSCTIHFIKEGIFVNRLLAIKCMKGESCTGN